MIGLSLRRIGHHAVSSAKDQDSIRRLGIEDLREIMGEKVFARDLHDVRGKAVKEIADRMAAEKPRGERLESPCRMTLICAGHQDPVEFPGIGKA